MRMYFIYENGVFWLHCTLLVRMFVCFGFFFRKKRKPYCIETMKFKSNAIKNNNKFSNFYSFVDDESRIIILGVKKENGTNFFCCHFSFFSFFHPLILFCVLRRNFFLYIVKYNDERVYAINQVKICLNVSCSCLFSINSV